MLRGAATSSEKFHTPVFHTNPGETEPRSAAPGFFVCHPLYNRRSLIHSPHLNPKTEPLTQRAAHGGRYTVQRGRSASESTKGGIR